MSNMVEVKTADLIGPALDWAVALAVRGADQMPSPAQFKIWDDYHPSTDWAQGGPLIDKYRIWLSGPIFNRKDYSAAVDTGTDESRGTTALIALCRALVTAKLGDVVQVPAQLIGVAS